MENEIKTHLDLFSGIGGFALAAKWAGFETVAFCEIEDYPRKVLEKNFPGVPIHRDVREIDGNDYRDTTLITGGYPCQPFSLAGQRGGEEDDRHLWPEMFRIIKQARPAWVVAENVFGHITMGLDQVLSDLESEGYACRPVVIPACAVDAPHRRDRVWIIANSESTGTRIDERWIRGLPERCGSRQEGLGYKTVADATQLQRNGGGKHSEPGGRQIPQPGKDGGVEHGGIGNRWIPEPDVGRVVARIPAKLDRGRLDGQTSETGTGKILRTLQQGADEKTIQWEARGLQRVHAPRVLFSELCEFKGSPDTLGTLSLQGEKTSQIIMRSVWFDRSVACSSCGRESDEQRGREYSDPLRLLSQLLACSCGATWIDPTGTPSAVNNRVHRLKGLGNAIVPQVAYQILRLL